jgi:ATP-dependent Lon protease
MPRSRSEQSTRKRKRSKKDTDTLASNSDDDFIDNSIDNNIDDKFDDPDSPRGKKYIRRNDSKKLTSEQSASLKSIRLEINCRDVKLENILALNLPMDDNIWFIEHLDIMECMEPNTTETYKIKNMIYQKYINLKSISNIESLSQMIQNSGTNDSTIQRIIKSPHPHMIKAILYRKYKRCYDAMNEGGDEMFKIIDWIDTVLDLPVAGNTPVSNQTIDLRIKKLWNALGQSISGLNHVKESIIETMCTKLIDPENKTNIITLVGPPGTGKTAVSSLIASALDMPFDQISFGSVKDSNMLIGHSSTYIGSGPGLFTKILLKSKRLDTVVLLDEVDKIPDSVEGKSIQSVLLHALDRTQNHRFRDMYMPEISLDLSKMIFILAANSIESVDPILRDRLSIIHISGYSLDQKVQIVGSHILPRVLSDLKFCQSDIIFDDNSIKYLIECKTTESPGMRDTERKVYKLFERIKVIQHTKNIKLSYSLPGMSFPLTIDKRVIDRLLESV